MSMEFRLFGSVEAVLNGNVLDLGARRQRALLSFLLLNANRVVSTDQILEALWGDDAFGKENALWVVISRLRSSLAPERAKGDKSSILVTRENGYRLEVDIDAIDLTQFEAAVERARHCLEHEPSEAVQAVDVALALWRGAPLGEFRDEEFAQTDVRRIEDLRLQALELRADAELRLGRGREQISGLEALHVEQPTRERFVELLMRSHYQAGHQAEALRVFDRYRRTLGETVGIDPSPELHRLEEQILLHDAGGQPEHESAATGRQAENPYKGLRAFLEDDAEDFFGRDRLLAELLRGLGTADNLLAVVGPSGSGKSSIVRAGLVPAIRKGALVGSERWLVAQMVPGAHPFAEAEAGLLRSTLDAPDSITDQLHYDNTGLLRSALRLLPDDSSKLLLVIDQFEELFTLVEEEEVRTRFLANVATAVDDSRNRVKVVVTLRADFYDRPLQYPDFGSRLSRNLVSVTPMTADELEAAAVEPARRAGVSLEPSLRAELIAGVGRDPGGLPVFQFALTELFDRRVGDTVPLEAYRALGGLEGALSRRADDLYRQLSEEEQAAARQLFLRLVTIAEGETHSRRRVPASELTELDIDVVATQAAIELFGRHRLLTFDRDRRTGAPTVEVAHEALLTAWPQLADWLAQSHEEVQRLASLRMMAQEWSGAARHGDYLLTGSRLDEYETWHSSSALALTRTEHDFLVASAESRTAEAGARAATRRKHRGRLRLAALVAVVGIVVAGFAGVVALRESDRADDEAERAVEAVEVSEVATLIAQSAATSADNPELSLLLALEAHRRAPGAETQQAVLDALNGSALTSVVASHRRLPTGNCDFKMGSTDARTEYALVGDALTSLDLATGAVSDHGSPPAECVLWLGDKQANQRWAGTPDGLRHWFGPFDGPWEVELQVEEPMGVISRAMTGDRLIFQSPDEAASTVTIVDTRTGRTVGEPLTDLFMPWRSVATSADGRLIALGVITPGAPGGEGRVLILDAETGSQVTSVDTALPAMALVFDDSTGELLAAADHGHIITIDPELGAVVADVQTTATSAFLAVGVRPDGLVVAVSQGQIELVDRRMGPVGPAVEVLPGAVGGRVREDGAVAVVTQLRADIYELDTSALPERVWNVDPFAYVEFGAGRAVAARLDDLQAIDLDTGARQPVELVMPNGDPFTSAGDPQPRVVAEPNGYLATSAGVTVARWEQGLMVERIYLGSEQGVGSVWARRFADRLAMIGQRPDGTTEAYLIAIDPGRLGALLTVEAGDATSVVPASNGGFHVMDSNGTLRTYDSAGQLMGELATEMTSQAPLDRAARDELSGLLAFGGRDGAIIVEPVSGEVERLPGVVGVDSLGFARGGELLVIVGNDGDVRLWDVGRSTGAGLLWNGTGAAQGSPPWYDDTTQSVWVATSGKLLQFSLDPQRWTERACEIAGRDFTEDEWSRFVAVDQPVQSVCP